MNKSELITRMAQRLNGDRAAASAAVNGVLEEIEGSVARGERVSLTGFGTFDRRQRASRTGRNPRTGETIQVGPSVVAVFRPGTGFKSLLTAANGVTVTTASAVTDSSLAQAEDDESVTATADALDRKEKAAHGPDGKKKAAHGPDGKKKAAHGPDGKKAAHGSGGEKAAGRSGKKASKKASKGSKKKPGKDAAGAR